VWAGIEEGAGALKTVAEAIEGVGERFGFPREQRAFTGHVTVGRSKGRGVDARAALDAFAGALWRDDGRRSSRLREPPGGEGSTYVLRSRAALASN
jgi:hypothetical protein